MTQSTVHSDQTFSNLLNIPSVRTETLEKLTLKNHVEVSSALERYTNLSKARLVIVGKLYGNKKYQAMDEELHAAMVVLRNKVEEILKLY